MSRRALLACAWAGPVMVVLTLGGWLLCGILPVPPSPNDSQAEVVDFYAEHADLVRLGLTIATLGLSGAGPLCVAIAFQMYRMEDRPVLTVLQLVAGTVTWIMVMAPTIMMIVAAFRPERSPETTQTLNDLAWLLFLTPVAPFIVQNVCIGAAILGSERPVLPRWVGYLNYWVALLFTPALLAYFTKTGPVAWDGVFVFWLAVAAYGLWAVVMGLVVRRAILTEERATIPA